MPRIALESSQPFHQMTDWFEDADLVAALSACIDAQRRAAAGARQDFQPDPRAEAEVSPEALEKILASGKDIHGIATQRSISNVIAFNSTTVGDSVDSDEVRRLREAADRMVTAKLRDTIQSDQPLGVTCSGHFWYPPGAYMGWHTNSGAPGWRIYLTHAAEPGASFFRYRDPATGEVITTRDHAWDVRMFRVDAAVPLWHAVYSQTDRFSLGYVVHAPRPWWKRATRGLRRMAGQKG